MKSLLILFSFLFATISYGQDEHNCYLKDPNGRYRQHNVDFKHLKLEVSFDTKKGMVNGIAEYVFQPIQKNIDSIFLDGPGIEVKNITLNDDPQNFRTNEKGIIIDLDPGLNWESEYTLQIDYTATPVKGLYFIGWNDPKGISRKQIWTQGQGIDNRHWIPSYDGVNDKLTTETIIHFKEGYEVLSNGNLVSKNKNADGMVSWHYKMTKPHVIYLIMIGIGEYKFKDMISENGIRSRQYYYPEYEEYFDVAYHHSNEMMDWCENEFGVPYPWETYANIPVQDFMYGAMENTTATVLTDFYMKDERAGLERDYLSTNAHELVHQWFGDYITEWSGTHHWLHESYATHYAKHFVRTVKGEDHFNWERRGEMKRSWEANKKDQIPVAHSKGGSARHYPKGSIVIDMLRYVVGEEEFRKVLQHFLKTNEYDLVDTHEFYLAFNEILGMNLDWFFDQWLYRGGEPHYEVEYSNRKKAVTFYVHQTHEKSNVIKNFRMPVHMEVYYEDGSTDKKMVYIEGPIDTVVFQNPDKKKIAYTLFDPNYQILKTIDFDKEEEELKAQASMAKHMIDRYDAIAAMAEIPFSEKKLDFLLQRYDAESFHAIKSEILKQLINEDHPKVMGLIQKAAADNDHLVNRTIINDVDSITPELIPVFIQFLNNISYVNIETAFRKLAKQHPDITDEHLQKIKEIDGFRKNIRTTYLEFKVQQGDSSHLKELMALSSQSYEFRTRLNAMRSIERLNIFNNTVVQHLVNGVLSFNRRLAGPSTRILKSFIEEDEAYEDILSSYLDGLKLTEHQQSILETKELLN